MKEETKQYGVFVVLGLVWFSSVVYILAQFMGLVIPILARPQTDNALLLMLISGFVLSIYSHKTGFPHIKID